MSDRPPVPAAVAVLAAGGLWATAFLLEPSLPAGTRWLLGIGAWLWTLVALTGLLVARARWAVRLGLGVAALAVPGVALVDAPVLVGLGAGAAAASVWTLLGAGTAARVRPDRAADAPPDDAVVLMAVLVSGPLAAGLASLDGGPHPVTVAMGAIAPILAWWFGRISGPALWTARVGFPALALAAAVSEGLPWGIVAVVHGAVVAWYAWRPGSALAAAPLDPTPGEAKPVFAEFAPREVRAVAGIDERGRRR
ncbi:MAG: hypothetical protein AB1Z55_05475 [Acidimicrobiia bacterium]